MGKIKGFLSKIIRLIGLFFKGTVFLARFLILLFFVFISDLIGRSPKRRLDKPRRSPSFSLKFLEPAYNKIYIRILKVFDTSDVNEVKDSDLILLALKNLAAKKNRTYITIGGMAIGFGAVILLLSLGYGFEKLVISQVASLSEMKQIDINTVQGSPLSFTYDVITEICETEEVDIALPIITAVSKVEYNNAVSDIIVYGVTTRYLVETGLSPLRGEFYEDQIRKENPKISKDEGGDVAGVSTKLIGTESLGSEIYQVKYSIYPLIWKPVYLEPSTDSKIVGYTKRGFGRQDAMEVWGYDYEEADREKVYTDYTGKKYSPWIKDAFPIWEKKKCSEKDHNCFEKEYLTKFDGSSQVIEVGYITQNDVELERYRISINSGLEVSLGKSIEEISFAFKENVQTDMYLDLAESSMKTSVLDSSRGQAHQGFLVYGNLYNSNEGYYMESDNGDIFSYWVKADLELWTKEACSEVCDLYYTEPTSDDDFKNNLTAYFKVAEVEIEDLDKESLVSSDQKDFEGDVLGLADAKVDDPNFIEIGDLAEDGEEGDDIDWAQITSELSGIDKVEVDTKKLPEDAQLVALANTAMLNLLGVSVDEAIGEVFESTFVFDSKLFGKTNYLVESEKVSYKIIGVVSDSKAPTFYVPYNDIVVNGMESVSNLKVVLKNTEDIGLVRRFVESLGFQTSSVVDTVERIGSLFSTLRVALLVLGLIALGVASLGMFNTLTVSLLEKTREVGLLKTMGMKSDEIKVLFLAESVIMSAMGGLMGILVGFLVGKLISFSISALAISQGQGAIDVTHIPVVLGVAIIILSFVVGVITGWYPAKRATAISALNALRYE